MEAPETSTGSTAASSSAAPAGSPPPLKEPGQPRPHSKSAGKTSKRAEKQATRRHQALEKEFSRAQKLARLDSSVQREPEATFTPTAAGLRREESIPLPSDERLAVLIAQAVDRALEARAIPPRPPIVSAPVDHDARMERECAPSSPSGSSYSEGLSIQDQDEELDILMSEEEEQPSNVPTFSGMFNPSSFVTLLKKVSSTARLGAEPPLDKTSANPDPELDPNFTEPIATQHKIPCPPMFITAIKKQWVSPTNPPLPTTSDKKLFNVAQDLEDTLEVPTVDEPFGPLISPTAIAGDISEALKAEERKSEMAFRKTHQAIAWAVKAASSASVFNRAAHRWLKQLQARTPPEDLRSQQDIRKMVAAMEYASDATLQATKFASRAMASSVSARRMLWLKHWHADARSKWRLASAPYQGGKLFGEALSPYLTENKDKRKVLSHIIKKQEGRKNFFPRRQSFRTGDRYNYSQPFRPFPARQERQDRQDDRQSAKSRSQFQGKRPFRGGGRPFRRSR